MTDETGNSGAAGTGAAGTGAAGMGAAGTGAAGTGAAGTGAAGTGAAGTGAAGADTGSWHAGLGADDLALVETKGWKGKPITEVLSGYRNLEKAIGADKIALPPKDDKGNRDFAKIDYGALGRPEKPESYEFKNLEGRAPNDGDKAFQDAMRQAFHKAGLNPYQAGVLNESYNAVVAAALTANEAHVAKSQQDAVAALQQEWGAAYRSKMELANRAVKAVLGPDLAAATELKLADGSFVFDHPLLAKAFAKIGESFGEDTEIGAAARGKGTGGALSPAEAEGEIKAMERPGSETMKILTDKAHPEYQALNEKRRQLYAIAYPGEVASA